MQEGIAGQSKNFRKSILLLRRKKNKKDRKESIAKEFVIALKGKLTYHVSLGTDIHGNITRLDNEIARFEDNLERCREKLENTKVQLETARVEAQKPFPKEQELSEKTARLGELNALLDMDKKDKIVLDEEPEEEMVSEKSGRDRER